MKVIFKKTGEIKEVSLGYAVNFLIPQGLAEPATPERVRRWEEKRRLKLAKKQQQEAVLKKKVKAVAGRRLVFKVKVGPRGGVYGSVTAAMIAKKLGVKKAAVELDKPLKKVGEYEVVVSFKGEKAKVKVVLEAEK